MPTQEDFRRTPGPRRGLALGIVLAIGVIVLMVGLAMVTSSGSNLLSGVDAKQRIKARIAAETQGNLQLAIAADNASRLFGTDMTIAGSPKALLPGADGLQGSATVEKLSSRASEKITSGQYKGLYGLPVAFRIHAKGFAPGGATSKIDMDLKIYQVPIFQFGVFYEGNLEITPGPDMNVGGPVHTNSSLFVRASYGATTSLLFLQGPVSATGSIYQWRTDNGAYSGQIRYALNPDTSAFFAPTLSTRITLMDSASRPAASAGTYNVQWGADRMTLPIGATARALLDPAKSSDDPALARQKFDRTDRGRFRWIAGASTAPGWITGPRVFWNRREVAWVKFWDVDVSKVPADYSVIYLADTLFQHDQGTTGKQVINAFRLRNAQVLPRNLTIATPNSIYLVGDFNKGRTDACKDETTGATPNYCNALIACDAFTYLTPMVLSAAGQAASLEQPASNAHWATAAAPEPASGVIDAPMYRRDTVFAAIMTGNKATQPDWLPTRNTDDLVFNSNYEGGWHNTIRFLENLGSDTLDFKGSFICMWEASDPALNHRAFPNVINSGGFYSPPRRNWGFDPRFKDLNNMPPATPFLATSPVVSWSEKD